MQIQSNQFKATTQQDQQRFNLCNPQPQNFHHQFQQLKYHQLNSPFIASINQQRSQQGQNNKFQFYKPQTQLTDGTFDLRFDSIKNSPINQNALLQAGRALTFQTTKLWKSLNIFNLQTNQQFPKQERKIKPIQYKASKNQIKMTWIGHASVLLSIEGHTHILIDPMFQKRLIPTFGQKRFTDPAVDIKDLPQIDFVLVSHDHFDHCNQSSLNQLYNRFQNKTIYLVGKNSKNLFHKDSNLFQLSWTQSLKFKNNNAEISFTFVPACHWSKRMQLTQNTRLWGGFVIETLGKKIYFPGDTGYCGLFKELEQFFEGFDLSLLPIGAYQPNQQLKAQHINPKQAVIVHNETKTKMSVGIHWGTFQMSHESPAQVVNDFTKAIKDIQKGQFVIVNIGGGVTINCQSNIDHNKVSENKIQVNGRIQVKI